jgi:aminoglycoside phosphotransferase (APT) family kinase protein
MTDQVVGQVSRHRVDDFNKTLEDWLANHVEGCVGGRIRSLHSPVGSGLSGETYIVSLEQPGRDSATRRFVVKKEAATTTNPQANFNYLVQAHQVLGGIEDLRVPRVLGFEPSAAFLGAPFVVIEFIEGNIPSDMPSYAASGWVREASADQRSRMWRSGVEFLVRLHSVDWQAFGLDQLRLDAAGSDDLERCLTYSIDLFRQEAGDETSSICEEAISWLRTNRPLNEVRCFCWGDARIGNIIWRDFDCAAVIDWEMSSMGCPGMDLGWWSFVHRWSTFGQGHPELAGMCVGEDLAHLYETCGGSQIENIRYYEILANIRLTSVWLRLYRALRAENKLSAMAPLGESVHMIKVLRALLAEAS